MNTSISAETETGQAASPRAGGGGTAAPVKSNGVPVLPVVEAATESQQAAALLRELREFHLSDGDDGAEPWSAAGVLPALMSPFRSVDKIRYDFPLFLYPPETAGDLLCRPLPDWLTELVSEVGSGTTVLEDNLERLEQLIRAELEGKPAAVPAHEVVVEAGNKLQAKLALGGDAAAQLAGGLADLAAQIPSGGQLLAYRDETAIHLILAAARVVSRERRAAFLTEVRALRRSLREMLAVDHTKDPSAREPDALVRSMGNAALLRIDPAAMSEMMGPHRGAPQMGTERRERVKKALAALDSYVAAGAGPLVVVVHSGDLAAELDSIPELQLVRDGTPCVASGTVFDQTAAAMAEIFRAVRVARLESRDKYVPELHGPWLARLDWDSFSREELGLLPVVVTLESADQMIGDGLVQLSRLIRSGRPIKLLVASRPAANPDPGDATDPVAGIRFEVGYFGLSLREAVVQQSTPARPAHMLAGLRHSLELPRPAIHVYDTGVDAAGNTPALGGWLYSSAAVESRAQPLFAYDPEGGASFARRFDFSGNPQPDGSWPTSELAYHTEGGGIETMALPFTFADFALLDPAFRQHFRLVPAGCPSEALVPVDTYLALPADQTTALIPYVWAVDADNRLVQLAITRRMCFVCADRLGYWRTLQELAGVHNEYVEAAVAEARAQAEAEAEAERAALLASHAEELEAVRAEAGGDAMQRLAAVLMDADISAMTSGPAAPAKAAAAAPAAAAEPAVVEPEAAPEPEPEPEDEGFSDPWIDAAMCTSCNDCINLNPQMFVYNENKQATIGDLKAGTYAQMVQAAEKCASRCIHPGKPWDSSEPGLDELIKRAAPFN